MNENQIYEHCVRQKNDALRMLRKILFILMYIVFASVWVIIGLKTGYIFPLIVISALLTGALVAFTWLYTKVDYEYSIVAGILKFSKIYGSKKRKDILETDIKDALFIAPYCGGYVDKADAFSPVKVYSALSEHGNKEDASACVMIFEDDNGDKAAFLFEGDDKALKMMRYYNPSVTHTERKGRTV